MNRGALAALVALATVIAVRMSVGTPPSSIPLISIAQGITPYQFGDHRVFVVRSGEVVTVFGVRSGRDGKPVQWCPREQTFWAAATNDLFSAQGHYAFGAVNHDMVRYPVTRTQDFLIKIDFAHPQLPRRSDGRAEIPAPIYEFYQRFLNYNPEFPTPTRPVFCPNPIT